MSLDEDLRLTAKMHDSVGDTGIGDDLRQAADRLAQYERDLRDDIGKDRSQDTDWLRAGFLQRGAQIERLEDGIRTLATGKEGVAQVARQSGDEDTALRAERDARELRGLLDD